MQARLTPGGPIAGLPGVANSLLGADLVLISEAVSEEMLNGALFYLPRLMHGGSVVLRSQVDGDGASKWQPIEPSEISQRAEASRPAAAA